jgi:hypothetical protein
MTCTRNKTSLPSSIRLDPINTIYKTYVLSRGIITEVILIETSLVLGSRAVESSFYLFEKTIHPTGENRSQALGYRYSSFKDSL